MFFLCSHNAVIFIKLLSPRMIASLAMRQRSRRSKMVHIRHMTIAMLLLCRQFSLTFSRG